MFEKLVKSLFGYCNKDLQFKRPPRLFIKQDSENSKNPLGKTAYYQPNEQTITVYGTGRHCKDMLRSIAHELVHHHQNERGDFDNCGGTEPGYAQNDEHLRNMEKEAYLKGNMLFRDWEDSCKKQIQMEEENKMKLSELKKIIKETIEEIVKEKTATKQTNTTLDEGGCDSHGKREDKKSEKKKEKTDEGKAHAKCKNGCYCEPIKESEEPEVDNATIEEVDEPETDTIEEVDEPETDNLEEGGCGKSGKREDKKSKPKSKVMTPEKEKALKENYMGEKRNRLFEKLTKKWTK